MRLIAINVNPIIVPGSISDQYTRLSLMVRARAGFDSPPGSFFFFFFFFCYSLVLLVSFISLVSLYAPRNTKFLDPTT
jgi:hypothetical protein